MPLEALPLVLRHVGGLGPELPGVVGPPEVARAFAEGWARSHGLAVRPGPDMDLHVVTELVPPSDSAPGTLRLPRAEEVGLLEEWGRRFVEEAGINVTDDESPSRALMAQDALHLWDHDGRLRSMAGALGPTPRGIRIGYVYTPPPERGRGYATALVFELTRRLLEAGRDFCFLYTDRANPTSNGIYRRLGYHPVARSTLLEFEAPPRG